MLEEIWIITNAGAPIFHLKIGQDPEETLSEDSISSSLIGGFWSAINSFAIGISGGDISNVQLASYQIAIKKDPEGTLLFLGLTRSKTRDKQIDKILTKIMTEFKTLFPNVDNRWDGNTDTFLPFFEVANKILNDTYGSKFKKGLSVS